MLDIQKQKEAEQTVLDVKKAKAEEAKKVVKKTTKGRTR